MRFFGVSKPSKIIAKFLAQLIPKRCKIFLVWLVLAKNHVYCAKIAVKKRPSKSTTLIDSAITVVHFSKFFL